MVDHYENSKPLDLIVRNGTLVIPGVGRVKADVGIADGKIAVLAANLAQKTAEVYDASGRTVLPGIFDPHIHLGNGRCSPARLSHHRFPWVRCRRLRSLRDRSPDR